MYKKTLFAIFIFLIGGLSIYYYVYQGHRNIDSEKAAYTLETAELQKDFIANDSLALLKYQDQTIELRARITLIDLDNNALVLDNKVFATFNDSLPEGLNTNEIFNVKGRFLGYDELLDEFRMDQSSIVK